MQPDSLAQTIGWSWPRLDRTAILESSLQIVVIFILAGLAFWALRFLIGRLERAAATANRGPLSQHEQRVVTLLGLGRSVGTVVIIAITLFMVLAELGFDI